MPAITRISGRDPAAPNGIVSGRQPPLAAAEQRDGVRFLAGRARHHLDAGLQDVLFRLVEDQVGGAAAEQLAEERLEVLTYLLEGLAEALAAYLHNRIRAELKLKKEQGKRYSPGYPLWRDLSDQDMIFRLLDVEKRIGITLTEGYQMVPEQSTTAMIVHSDKAEY